MPKPLIQFRFSTRELWIGYRLEVRGGRADVYIGIIPFFPLQLSFFAADPMLKVADYAMVRPNIASRDLGVGEVWEVFEGDGLPSNGLPSNKRYKLFFEKNNYENWFRPHEIEKVELSRLSEMRPM